MIRADSGVELVRYVLVEDVFPRNIQVRNQVLNFRNSGSRNILLSNFPEESSPAIDSNRTA